MKAKKGISQNSVLIAFFIIIVLSLTLSGVLFFHQKRQGNLAGIGLSQFFEDKEKLILDQNFENSRAEAEKEINGLAADDAEKEITFLKEQLKGLQQAANQGLKDIFYEGWEAGRQAEAKQQNLLEDIGQEPTPDQIVEGPDEPSRSSVYKENILAAIILIKDQYSVFYNYDQSILLIIKARGEKLEELRQRGDDLIANSAEAPEVAIEVVSFFKNIFENDLKALSNYQLFFEEHQDSIGKTVKSLAEYYAKIRDFSGEINVNGYEQAMVGLKDKYFLHIDGQNLFLNFVGKYEKNMIDINKIYQDNIDYLQNQQGEIYNQFPETYRNDLETFFVKYSVLSNEYKNAQNTELGDVNQKLNSLWPQ